MAGFLKRLFETRRKVLPTADAGDLEGTLTASPIDQSEARVEAIRSAQFSPVAAQKSGPVDQEKDTGPWFIGKTVGEIYQIRGVLGRGGMGIVYRGYDTATQREIAIKVPLGKFVDDESARKRFTREAEVWGSLIHPHIVHAFDVIDDQTTDYRPAVFMDFCDGGSLADRLRDGPPLSLADALDIAIQVCWAMEFAHENGHIHRDLKPGNVMLTKDGKALVSDFGLVKSLDLEELEVRPRQLGQSDGVIETSLSRGLVMGTPEYMPPEQWAGKACPQSDVYAFGIMLYELFWGARPFTAPRRADLWIPHCKAAPPDPRAIGRQLAAELAELMISCLSKGPSGRPQSFATVAERLSRCYQEVRGEPHTARRAKASARDVSTEQGKGQAWALLRLGNGCRLRGDMDDAMRQIAKASDIFATLGDDDGLQAGLGNQALILRTWGRLDEALELHRRQERICRRCGNEDGLGASLGNQGVVLKCMRRLDEAQRLLRQEEAICRRRRDNNSLQINLGNQALLLQDAGRLDEAMELLRQKEAICHELGNKNDLQVALGNRANIFCTRGNPEKAMELYSQSEAIAREVGNRECVQATLSNRALILNSWSRRDEAMELLKEAEAICRATGTKDGLQAVLGNQAMILRAQDRTDQAMDKLMQQATICRELKNKAALQECLHSQAAICYAWSHLREAFDLYEQQEAVCREINAEAGLAASLNQQALILQTWGRLEEAMDLLREQEAICHRLGDKHKLQACLANQGVIHQTLGRLSEALSLYQQQEPICRETDSKDGLQVCLGNQALILQMWGRLDEAMDLYKRQEAICRESGNKDGLQRSLGNQALVLRAWRRYKEAMELLKQKEAISREIGNLSALSRSLLNQAVLLDEDMGHRAEAIPLLVEAREVAAQSEDVRLLEGIELLLQKMAQAARDGRRS